MQPSFAESTLPVAGPVQSWEIDGIEGNFQDDIVPALREGLGEFDMNGELPAIYDIFYVNPSKLTLIEPSEINVYFALTKEGPPRALGINFEGMGVNEGNPMIVFPDLTSLIPYVDFYQGANITDYERKETSPLLPGDWVDLGFHEAGESLNFFLCNADDSSLDVYTGDAKLNPGKEAAMMVMSLPDSALILVGFRNPDSELKTNYFDYVFIVTVSEANAAHWLENNGVRSPLRSILSIKGAFISMAVWCLNMVRRYGLPVLIFAILVIAVIAWRSFIIFRRQGRKRRANALYKKAQENLAAKPPRQDMRLIRKGQQLDRDTKNEQRWEALRMQSGAVSRDFSTLLDCAESATTTFEEDEGISLIAARAAAELGRTDLFEQLHNMWDNRSEDGQKLADPFKVAWSTLEADSFNTQRRYQDAQSALELDGASEPSVLARLAYLQHRDDPAKGWGVLKSIKEATPETYRFQARMLEREGKIQEAEQAYRAALQGAPNTIFVVDEVAEFYRHNGNMQRALSMWSTILLPSTPDEIWVKALFFSRVTGLPLENVSPENIPLTPAQPLLNALLTWPTGMFWNEQSMSELFQKNPALSSWQAVFWLRLIEQLCDGKEGEALAQLNLSRSGEFSWERALELVLVSVIAYRRAGIIPPEIKQIIKVYIKEASKAHVSLLKVIMGVNADATMRRPDVFIQLFNAVGWGEVVNELKQAGVAPQA